MDVTKERIINQAIDLFMQIGVKTVTMDMISERLGMSKKTLYEHFSSKEELIKTALFEHISLSVANMEEKLTVCENAIHQKLIMLRCRKNLFLTENFQISFQLEKFYPEIYAEILEYQKQIIKKQIKHNLIQGIEEELYRAKVDKKIITEYFYLTEPVITNDTNPEDTELYFNYFVSLLLRSITTKKGLKELEKLLQLE